MERMKDAFIKGKEFLLSLDNRKKVMVGVVALALVVGVAYGGYRLSTKPSPIESGSIAKVEDKDKEEKDDKKEDVVKSEETKKDETNKDISNVKKPNETPSTAQPQTSKPSSESGGNSGNSGSKPNITPTPTKPQPQPNPTPPTTPVPPKPQPPVTPQPQPTPPVKPQLTVANCPDYLRYGGVLFATMAEAESYRYEQSTTIGSPNYGKIGIIDTITDPYFTGQIYKVSFD